MADADEPAVSVVHRFCTMAGTFNLSITDVHWRHNRYTGIAVRDQLPGDRVKIGPAPDLCRQGKVFVRSTPQVAAR
jgi:hypothetical protein